jgi:hypothetical protein
MAGLLGEETNRDIKNKIDGIENLSEEDFETLIVMMQTFRRT